MAYTEENNYPKALVFSAMAMAILLVISYFVIIGTPFTPQEVGTGGIIVNYGTSGEGMGDDYLSVDEPSVSPDANGVVPDNVSKTPNTTATTQSSTKSVVTQDAEDAPNIATKNKNTTNTPATSSQAKQSAPAVNQNALYKGKANNGTGSGDGTGGAPGNQGSKNGDPLSPNYGEGGSGFGGLSLSLANRRFVSIPRIDDDGQIAGKIAVEIRVDKNGVVVSARAGVLGTTITDTKLWRKCEAAVTGARLNQLESAPDVQIGKVFFNFKVK